jgi:hypothetical protein
MFVSYVRSMARSAGGFASVRPQASFLVMLSYMAENFWPVTYRAPNRRSSIDQS